MVVRLGAMGDIIHALPAAAALKRAFPGCTLSWAVEPRWRDLLDGGGLADALIEIDRRSYSSVAHGWQRLRSIAFDLAIDFQGLIKSAAVTRAARAAERIGFERAQLREAAAGVFYTRRFHCPAAHVVDRNLQLAAHLGASTAPVEFPLPPGRAEGDLPAGPFILASPLAGWKSKQWPAGNWSALARLIHSESPYQLVLNGPPAAAQYASTIPGAAVHISSVAGLIHATRLASAVVGLDSGPLHLAASLSRPALALFGPTDPSRNGPYGPTVRCLRAPEAETTYARGSEIHPSMHALTPASVFRALMDLLEPCR
ncbi:MAG: glycosyltransferase family 9 protein [Bryobacteraceae bacterium]|nr:glycosyltransferase family 9 protein [Bryobacteraceae bacterium]